MVKSLDDLIRHLVDEVALRGEEGEIAFDLSSQIRHLRSYNVHYLASRQSTQQGTLQSFSSQILRLDVP
jgi:hypothetical protein